MSWFNNRGVSTRILAAIGVAAVVSVLVGGIGLLALGRTNSEADGLYATNIATIEIASTLRRSVLEMRLAATNQALSAGTQEISKFDAATKDAEASARAALASWRQQDLTADEVSQLDTFETALDSYVAIRDRQMLPAGAANDYAAWRQARDDAGAAITTMEDTVATLVQGECTQAGAAAARAESTYVSSRAQVLMLAGIGIALAIGVGIVVARSIVTGLNRVKMVCQALEENDLTVTSGLSARDEVGQMGSALDSAVSHLRASIGTIDSSATALAGAADEMAAAGSQISSTAEETSAQAGVVSAAAEQVSHSVQTVASGTEQMGARSGDRPNAAEAAGSPTPPSSPRAPRRRRWAARGLAEEIGDVSRSSHHRGADEPSGPQRDDRGRQGR